MHKNKNHLANVKALIMAEKSLRQTNSPAAGKAYNIVDGGDPVDGWGKLLTIFFTISRSNRA